MTKLFLIRGVPGSGKSTLAKKMQSESVEKLQHYEADMYFINESGEYVFDRTKLSDAHDWCYNHTAKDLSDACSVIVSNTFTRLWEMEKYIKLAEKLDVPVEIIECAGTYKNIHNVPESVIQYSHRNKPGE